MATATPAELMRRLGAHGSMPIRQRTLMEATKSAVMDPDDTEIAEIEMRSLSRITDSVFPDEGWAGGGSQRVLENLTRINENEDARELLVSAIPEMLQGQREA